MTSQLMSTIADTHKITTHWKCKSINMWVVRPMVWPAPDTSWHRDLWLWRKETRHTSSASSVLCYWESGLYKPKGWHHLWSVHYCVTRMTSFLQFKRWHHLRCLKGDMTLTSVTCKSTIYVYGVKFYGITDTTHIRKVKIVHIKNIFFLNAMSVPTYWVLCPVLTSPLSW